MRPASKSRKRASTGLQQTTLPSVVTSWVPASEAASKRACSGLRQATLQMMPGVVQNWESSESEDLAEIPSTLYLGEADVLRLRDFLDRAEDTAQLMSTLRRLSAMPITRALLISTKIGVTVGRLRRHADAEVSDLATRLVRVWKGQLNEERRQTAAKVTQR